MLECQQGTQRRPGVLWTSAWCQKLWKSHVELKRTHLSGHACTRAHVHARTVWGATDLCIPLWPLLFEVKYNLRSSVSTFYVSWPKPKPYFHAVFFKKGKKSWVVCSLPTHPPQSTHSPSPPGVLQDRLAQFLSDNAIRLIYIPAWKCTRCDSGKGTTWSLHFREPVVAFVHHYCYLLESQQMDSVHWREVPLREQLLKWNSSNMENKARFARSIINLYV